MQSDIYTVLFPGEDPGLMIVRDKKGKRIMSGKTNENGLYEMDFRAVRPKHKRPLREQVRGNKVSAGTISKDTLLCSCASHEKALVCMDVLHQRLNHVDE